MLSKTEQAGRYRKKIKLKRVDRDECDLQQECEDYLELLQLT